MNETLQGGLSKHETPGMIGNYWGGEVDRWPLHRKKQWSLFLHSSFALSQVVAYLHPGGELTLSELLSSCDMAHSG